MPKLFGRIEDRRATEAIISRWEHPLYMYNREDGVQDSGKGKSMMLEDVPRLLLAEQAARDEAENSNTEETYGNTIADTYRSMVKRSGGDGASLLDENGYLRPHDQTIGDCVSQGFLAARDIRQACETLWLRQLERFWIASTEFGYAVSRGAPDCGGGRLRGDGSVGAWMAQALRAYGYVLREKFGNIDLTNYDGNRAKKWGAAFRNIPQSLFPIAKPHLVVNVSLITSVEQARDEVYNGRPVVTCSQRGYKMRRDSQGFLIPSGRWGHCECITGFDECSEVGRKRPGFWFRQSWGRKPYQGPAYGGDGHTVAPEFGGWRDYDEVGRMIDEGDTWSVAGILGHIAIPEKGRSQWLV